jgi:hypothetical protein
VYEPRHAIAVASTVLPAVVAVMFIVAGATIFRRAERCAAIATIAAGVLMLLDRAAHIVALHLLTQSGTLETTELRIKVLIVAETLLDCAIAVMIAAAALRLGRVLRDAERARER